MRYRGLTMKSIRDSYFVVQGWMTVELGLSGLDLMVYAIIWGYCQNTQRSDIQMQMYHYENRR